MPDVLQGRAPRGPDGNLPRATLAVDTGHQIRYVRRDGESLIRVTCRCQLDRVSPWAPLAEADGHPDWALYNDLPHDLRAGTFVPVDEATGRER